jgi:site-specific DNA recombinase
VYLDDVNLPRLLAGIYLRCSTDRNDEASVTEQREECAADCDVSGWEARWYMDNDRSASRYARKRREEWERLLADLYAGLLGVVVLWESSRGDRKLPEWAAFLEYCRVHRILIHVVSSKRTYDLANAADWRALASEGVDNAYASDLTSQRIRRHLASAARKGRPHGPVGYGFTRRYDPVTRKLIAQEPRPPESEHAAELITRIARSEPLSAIRADLERRGIPGATGGGWDRQTIRQIALNPAYAGFRVAPGGELIPAWPPIVSPDVHRAAVSVLTARTGQASSAPRPGRQRHLLSYLARCGHCGDPGATLAAYTRRGVLMYKCRVHGCVNVAAAWLDELVTIAVCDALGDPGAAELYRDGSGESARLRSEAAVLRAQLDEWATAAVSPHAYQLKEAQLLPRIERAERAAAAAETPLVLRELLTAGNARAGWDHLDVPARRAVIRALMTISVARAGNQARAARTDPGRVLIGWHRG